jgi:hypothetical protein
MEFSFLEIKYSRLRILIRKTNSRTYLNQQIAMDDQLTRPEFSVVKLRKPISL